MENTQQIQTAELNTSTYELIPAPEIKPEKYGYKIVNVVASGILKLKENSSIDFDCLEKLFDVKRMNRFPSIIYKLGVVSIILFKNGKMIITGIRDINQITGLKEIIETDLQEKGIKFDEFNIKIENLIAMTQLEKIIDLEMLCLKMNNVLYDPQQFSGAIIKTHSNCTFLLFGNSKILCLGVRELSQLEKCISEFIQDLIQANVFVNFQNSSTIAEESIA